METRDPDASEPRSEPSLESRSDLPSPEPRARAPRVDSRDEVSSEHASDTYLIERQAIRLRRLRWAREAATAPDPSQPERRDPDSSRERATPPPSVDELLRGYERHSKGDAHAGQPLRWPDRIARWLRRIVVGQ